MNKNAFSFLKIIRDVQMHLPIITGKAIGHNILKTNAGTPFGKIVIYLKILHQEHREGSCESEDHGESVRVQHIEVRHPRKGTEATTGEMCPARVVSDPPGYTPGWKARKSE